MPQHEFTHEDLDKKVMDSLEARRRRTMLQDGGAQNRDAVAARIREAMARRRQQGGQPQRPAGPQG